MAGISRLDSHLVAAGFDKNRNGHVSDDLKIEAPIDSDGNGQVSVAELAGAMARDQVVVSAGIVAARRPSPPADLPEIRTLKSVHQIASNIAMFGSLYPGWQYERTRTRSDGSTYTDYDWGSACVELRSKLEAIRAITGNMPGNSRARAIYDTATRSINAHTFGAVLDFLFDTRQGRSDYQALYSTLVSIQRMSDTPPEPAALVDATNKAVGGAAAAVAGLGRAAADPASQGAENKAASKAAELRQAAQAIPWWQYLLIFGFFKKMSLNNQAKKVEQNLATLKAANPQGLQDRAADLARQAYDIGNQAGGVNSIDAAFQLENSAKPVIAGSEGLRRDAQGQADRIQALFKALGGQ
ncbi:MAG: hypothetical protein FJZ01_19255 [Candidatus Sericytochromatia bacterium]|nr:hypothetical protein [Candidatus Tanganyikabacteria bacterium]